MTHYIFRPRWHEKVVKHIKKLKSLPLESQIEYLTPLLRGDKRHVKFEEKGDTATLAVDKSLRIKTLDDLIVVSDIDLEQWDIERYNVNKWEVGSTIDGEIIVEPLFQVKAWLKKNKSAYRTKIVKQELMRELKSYAPVYSFGKPLKEGTENLLEVNIFDLHFGKLCWGEETGDNYDTKIAYKRFVTAIKEIIQKVKPYKIARVVFPIGNDFYNADTLNNTTTAGTLQDEDVRWQKTFRAGRKMLIEGIDLLSKIAPVDVIIVQGNHDWQRSFYVGDALECWYHNNEYVNVNNNASPRKYYQYGKCLIGYTHGHNEKVADLPLIMASEQKQKWNDTFYREWHLGHLHHKREIKYTSTQEYKGATIRYMRSLSGSDAWHFQKGYISMQGCECFIWNKKEGLYAQFFINIK
tara:strand:- start:17245 stop:18471 length:1227 start_codon:yes stop_codon:yes gene_type:complete